MTEVDCGDPMGIAIACQVEIAYVAAATDSVNRKPDS